MASFTDSPQAFLPQYAPSVDLNLYAGTLDFKQQQYNQGVQRIQGSIDQIAGLDIMHPLAKDYLQQKLTDLGTKLNGMAGGDFSNQSLVGQAMMLAPQVAKDSVIQNAVVATHMIRSLDSDQNVQDKAGKYGPQARYHDNKLVSEYLNTPSLNAQYRGGAKATQYLDYHKPLQDFLDKQDTSDQETNIPNGPYTYKTVKTSTRSAADIQDLTNAFFKLNPQYQQSVDLDAEYNYKDYDAHALYPKVIGTMQDQLKQYANKYNKDYIDSRTHLHDPVYMKQYQDEASDTKAQIDNITSTIGKYHNMFQNGTPIDSIKRDLQMDEVRHAYTKLYTVDDKSEEIKANEDAIHTMQFSLEKARLGISADEADLNFMKAGRNRRTGKDLQFGDLGYNTFLAEHPAYAKSIAAKLQDPSQRVTVTPTTDTNTTNLYSDQGITNKINQVDGVINTSEGLLRKDFAQSRGVGFDHSNNVFTDPANEALFKKYQAEQELAVLHPETNFVVDPITGKKTIKTKIDQNYLDYRQDRTMTMLRKQNLIDLQTKVQADADQQFNLSTNRDVVHVQGTNVDIPMAQSRDFINILDQVNSSTVRPSVVINKGSRYERTQDDPGGYKKNLLQSIEQYKNTPYYGALHQIINNDSWDNAMGGVRGSLGVQADVREKYKSSQYKSVASIINPQGVNIDKDDFPEYRNYIAAALQNTPGGAKGIKDLSEVVPSVVYTDPSDKQAHIQYTEKDGTIGDVAVPSLSNIIGKPSASQELDDIISNSYSQITPSSGPNMLATPNGKLSYAIGKNQRDGTSWKLFLVNGEARIPINSPVNQGKYQSSLEAKKHIEDLSTAVNPVTKKPFTREEIIEMTKN